MRVELCENTYFRVFSEEFLDKEQTNKWRVCLNVIARTIKRIAKNDLTVSATCDVDMASGLPEYPIHGNFKFTQPVTSSLLSLFKVCRSS